MNTSPFDKMRQLLKAPLITLTAAAVSLTSCGDGPGTDDDATVRPQSLSGVVMSIGAIQFEFTRASANRAAETGDVESGIITGYNNADAIEYYSLEATGALIGYRWPIDIPTNTATYTYTAINDNAGQIVISTPQATIGDVIVPLDDTDYTHIIMRAGESITIPVSFTASGNLIASPTTISIIDNEDTQPSINWIGTFNPPLPHVKAQATFTTTDLQPLTVNYGAEDEDIISLAPNTLDGEIIVFFDSSGAQSHVMQFSQISNFVDTSFDVEETGILLFRNAFNVITVNAAPYTYNKTEGTNFATIELTGSTEAGTTTLDFATNTYTSPTQLTPVNFTLLD